MNLFDDLAATAARAGDSPAVTDVRTDRTLDYGRLHAEADAVARSLRALGVGPGARVGLLCPDGPAAIAASFGVLGAGASLTPIDIRLVDAEVRRVAGAMALDACLVAPGRGAPIRAAARRESAVDAGLCGELRLVHLDAPPPPPDFAAMHPAFIRFTSGTTGASKGVVISHEATSARVDSSRRVLGLSAGDRICWVLPLAYHFAVTIVAYVRVGAHVLLSTASTAGRLRDAIVRQEATVFYGSPVHVAGLAELPGDDRLPLRLALSTAAPIRPATVAAFEDRYGLPLAQAYGLIEAGLPAINTRCAGEPATSVGRPAPGYEIEVRPGERDGDGGTGGHALAGSTTRPSRDGGHDAPPESGTGEVLVRGPGLFRAYYEPWTPAETLCEDGWFPTGDVGRLDDDGCLHLLGRRKTVLIVAGMKVFPEEVEAHLAEHPAVAESLVVGRDHPRLGQVPCARLVLREGWRLDEASLRAHCREGLSAHKIPVAWEDVDALPRTTGGKLARG